MDRLKEYYSLLVNIYGDRIVKKFTTKNKKSLTMNSVAINQEAKKNYERNDGEGCEICKDKFRNERKINFFKRNLEFPGWIGDLNFSEDAPAKEIMIIGEAPPPLKKQINIAFGLGLYPIKSNGVLDFKQLRKTYSEDEPHFEKIRSDQNQGNGMWKYINLLFLEKLDGVKPNIYITDMCKCNDDIKSKKERKNEEIWKICRNKYLLEEIRLINPSLIIFQGWSPYKKIKEHFEEKYSREGITSNPHYGKFTFNGKQIPHFVIVHQSKVFGKNKLKIDIINKYINMISQFVKTKILKEVPEINKLLNGFIMNTVLLTRYEN